MNSKISKLLVGLLVVAFVLAACAPAATEEPAAEKKVIG